MQYYRLWIYSCNVVLALTSTIFIVFAGFVVADFRLTLLEGVELYHPTFLYAYGALVLQCGVIQTIGCLGAQRLSHKLLSLYWTLLLLLTLGDIGVGLYWVFHLERVKINLRPLLSKDFLAKYSTDETFTLAWHKIQAQDHCCGVDGPLDFEQFPSSRQAAFSTTSHVIVDVETALLSLPESCCTFLYAPTTVSNSGSGSTGLDKTYRVSHYSPEEDHPHFGDQSPEPSIITNDEHYYHHPRDFAGGGARRSSRTALSWPHKSDDPRAQTYPANEQEYARVPAFHENEYGDEEDDNDDAKMEGEYYANYLEQEKADNDNRNSNKVPYYPNYFHQSPGPLADVPDDHDDNDHQAPALPNQPNEPPAESPLQKRDITAYEPIHAHKVRHELHRKSQSSSLIDVKSLTNTTPSLLVLVEKQFTSNISTADFQENSTTSREQRFGESTTANSGGNKSRKDSSTDASEHYRIKEANKLKKHVVGLVEAKDEVLLVPRNVEKRYTRENHNKTSKLLPSISLQVRRERRETRASSSLSSSVVTQVPEVSSSAPVSQRHLICHGQPEGLNHHNSYKKDLLDQRKTTKEKREAGPETTLHNAKKVEAGWIFWKTTRTPPPASVVTKIYSLLPTPRTTSTFQKARESTSAEISYKMSSIEIARLRRSRLVVEPKDVDPTDNEEGLLAGRKSERVMMTASTDPALPSHHSSKLTSFLTTTRAERSTHPNPPTTETTEHTEVVKNVGMWPQPREKRAADISAYSVYEPNLQSVPRGNPKISRFTLKGKGALGRTVEPNSFVESQSHPLSSSSAASSSSSTSYWEVKSPQASIISSSSTPYEPWNRNSITNQENGSDNDESNGSANNGNGSSPAQKKLYVYGVGCGVKLIEWVDHVSGILFILGFCIIGFVKTCFLVILRTEIREMIEKIHMIEPEEVLSPSRTHSAKDRQMSFHVSHPLLQNPHRSSTVSAHGVLLPTIKSPDGPSSSCMPPSGMSGGYNRPNRHYLRRASNIVGGDRSRSHSNETVNMTLLMTGSQMVAHDRRSNPNLPISTSAGGSSGTITNIEEKDPVSGLSITVPNSSSSGGMATSSAVLGAARYLRRSSTCSSSTNPMGYPYGYGGGCFEGIEPRPGPSSRFYQYFEPLYQPPHLYQQHHHHHYARNRSHSRNMSCGAILPLASYRSQSAAAAASAALAAGYRVNRNLSSATTTTSNMPNSTGCSFSSTSKDETELVVSVSLEHIASSDQDEEVAVVEEEEAASTSAAATLDEEDVRDQEKKEWAAATSCINDSDQVKSASKVEDSADTKLQTFSHSESANGSESSSSNGAAAAGGGGGGASERDFQRRNGNNNVDLTNVLPMSYIGTAV